MMSIMKYILIMTSLLVSLHADIDEQIEAIQNAPVEERFKLMNAFKKNLVKMKEEERIEAMKKLTTRSHNKHVKKALEALKQQTKQKKMQRHIERQQIEENTITNEITDQYGGEDD